jgi:hypothetical protein
VKPGHQWPYRIGEMGIRGLLVTQDPVLVGNQLRHVEPARDPEEVEVAVDERLIRGHFGGGDRTVGRGLLRDRALQEAVWIDQHVPVGIPGRVAHT